MIDLGARVEVMLIDCSERVEDGRGGSWGPIVFQHVLYILQFLYYLPDQVEKTIESPFLLGLVPIHNRYWGWEVHLDR